MNGDGMGWKVVVTDDDQNVCKCLKNLVDWERLGCDIPYLAYDGRDALAFFVEEKIDFLICDLKMPGMDGLTLMHNIYEKSPDTDVIFISGYEDFNTAQEALRCGVKSYILKPINQQTLDELELLLKSLILHRESRKLRKCLFLPDNKQSFHAAIRKKDNEWLENFIVRLFVDGDSPAPLIADWIGDYLGREALIPPEAADIIVKQYLEKMSQMSDGKADFLLRECTKLMERQERMEENAVSFTESVKEHVLRNYSDENLGVETLAAEMGFSAGYIGRIFARDVGVSLQEFIIQTRMHEAKRLLRETRDTVAVIANRCGFSDANYFSKVFRKRCGSSPKEFRESEVILPNISKRGGSE